jgi:phosphoglucomutase
LIEFLRQCHRRAPFLFFNGNTFADIARQIVAALFAELSTGRRREVMSAVAHYIAGMLPWEAMVEIVESLSETADWKPGDRVKTLRSSLRGVIVRMLDDGRVVWKPDGTESELTALPEGLCADDKKKG